LQKEQTRNLTCSGGVFLNVKLNQRLWQSGAIDLQHIFPNAGDSGLALGAALYGFHRANPSAPLGTVDHLYWGPAYDNGEIEALLKLVNLRGEKLDDPAAAAAKALANDKIVGWFQGRMESGPRALGNRSILMSPLRSENKDIINARVKFREAFRPFCPSLVAEAQDTYLAGARREDFMITSFDVTDAKRERVPAVVHADGTLRPQTVTEQANPRYWRLLSQLGEETGDPIVLNTSFNVMGEPIVRSPQDALRCFFSCGLDELYLGDLRVTK